MKKNFILILISVLMLTACASQPPATPVTGTWLLVSYGPASDQLSTLPDLNRSLIFDADGKINGNVGCNSFAGTYTLQGDQISFQQGVSTQLACVPDIIMQQEAFTLKILSNNPKFKVDGHSLTLWTDEGTLILELDGN